MAMFDAFVKERFQRTYDAILAAAPVDVEEPSPPRSWISLRRGLRLL